MIKYLALTLAYIFLILTVYVDICKIKRKTTNQIRKTQCIAVATAVIAILLYTLEILQDKSIVFLFGKNYLLIGLCVFSFIMKKISKNSQK